MSASPPQPARRRHRSLHLLLALTVAATLLPMVLAWLPAAPLRAWVVAGAGLVHIALAMTWYDRVQDRPAQLRAYFLVQAGLILVILFVGRGIGSTPIAAMPFLVQAGMSLTSRMAWAHAALVLAVLGVVSFDRGESLGDVLAYILPGYGAAVLFSVLFARVLRNEREARDQVERLQAALQDRAAERERLRIARDIHDGLGHTLTVIATRLEAARHLAETDPGRTAGLLDQTTEMVREGLDEVRRSVAQMRDDNQAPADLPRAIRDLAARSNTSKLHTEVAEDFAAPDLDAPSRLVVWRTAQEGLTNAHRHSQGSRCVLRGTITADRGFTFTVEDDGIGPSRGEEPDESRHFGLAGLRERTHELGGSLAIDRSPLGGFRLTLALPAPPR